MITSRLVSFHSPTYVQAVNGDIANGQYQCNLTNGGSIEMGVPYSPRNFSSCSLVDGGFSAGSLSTTYSLDRVYALSGYNGQCQVFYGILPASPAPPLVSDALSVGGRVFIRLGDPGCLADQNCQVTSPSGNCDATLGPASTVDFSPLNFQFVDLDGSTNTLLEFSITSGNEDDYFSIDRATGVISLTTSLDRESDPDHFDLTVQITDGLFNSSYNVNVSLLDQNDNEPIPSMQVFTASIAEQLPRHTSVLNVTFTDADIDDNARLQYTLEATVTDFIIDNKTGEVLTNRVFDYEEGDLSFTFVVTATDNGEVPNTGRVNVIVSIDDQNDNRPEITVSLAENATFVEDGAAVRVADVSVNDSDASFNLVFAVIEISDAVDVDELMSVTVPPGVKSGSINGSLYIVGDITTSEMTIILQSAFYNNTAEEITPPLNRTIVYSVCDRFTDNSVPASLSQDTLNAIHDSSASNPDLPATDIAVLSTSCEELISSSVILPLMVVNDRPKLLTLEVEFESIPEDITDEENKGQLVISVFNDVVSDPDANGFVGVAIIGHGSPADAQSGSAGTSLSCMEAYTMCRADCNSIENLLVGESSEHYSIWKCEFLLNTVKFWFIKGTTGKQRSCSSAHLQSGKRRRRQTRDYSIENVDFSDAVQVELVLGTGFTFNLTSFYLENIDFDLELAGIGIENFVAFCQGNGTYIVTYSDGTNTTASLEPVTIDYTDIGNVSETSALLLGPYNLIRFVPHEFQFGIAWLEFKAWDGSDGNIPETRDVDTTQSSSFSLEVGNATINITAVNDPPEIYLGGQDFLNYTTVFTEGDHAVFITARDAIVVERDENTLRLQDLIITITKEDGSCDLPEFGQSFDYLFFPNNSEISFIIPTITRFGEACLTYTFSESLTVDQWSSYIKMLTFTTFADEPSDHRRKLEFVISDDFSTSLPSFTYIDVVLVSDLCPTLDLATTTPLTYIEHSSPIALDASLTVSDSDRNPQIQRAIVSIESSVTCTNCVLNSSVSLPEVVVTYGARTLTIDGPASPSVFQEVLRGIQFSDEGDEPAVNLLTVHFQLVDPSVSSDRCMNATGSISIVIDHVNDNSPVVYLNWPTDQNFRTTFTEGDSDIAVSAVSGDSSSNSVMIRDDDAQHSTSYTIFVSISDCIPSEDSLVISGGTTVTQPYDADSCSLELHGSIAALEADIEKLKYVNSDIQNPTEGLRVINFTILDHGVPATTSFSNVTVVAVNDPPVVYLDGRSTNIMVMFQLGDELVSVTDDGTITDHDNAELQSMSISLLEYDSSGTQLSSPSDGVFERIELADDSIRENLGLEYTAETDTTHIAITGTAMVADYTRILNEIVYVNSRIPPTLNQREVRVTVSDGEEVSAVAAATISFVGALDPPVVDLNGNEPGRDSTVNYTLTTSAVVLFPSATVTDPNGNKICRLEVTLSGSPDTCPPSTITFTFGTTDIILSESQVTGDTTVFTITSVSECRNNDIFENILRNIVFESDGTTGTCEVTVIAEDDSTLNSTSASGTISVRAYNDPPFIDLDLGYIGRDYSTVYYQGGRIRHIVSIFNANTSRNITTLNIVGEAEGEAALDGLVNGGAVSDEQSDAGYELRDSDSPSLAYLEAKFIKSSNPDNDVIRYPCKPQNISMYNPRGCTLRGESIHITDLECDDDVFEACSTAYDLCTGLEVWVFCPTSATKAYRFIYPSTNSPVARYKALLGYLGYEYLKTEGGILNQVRLIDISVSDGESINPTAITAVKLISFGLTIPRDPTLSFIVYEDERPERIISVFTVPVETLDGTMPEAGTVQFQIVSGNEDGKFSIDEDTGKIYLEEKVDREERGEYRLQVTAQIVGADDDTRATAEVVADIIDVNDEHPVVQESFQLNATEGTADLFIVDVNATDADEGINAELMYLLLGIGVENFYISTDGIVRTRKALNVSEENFYLLVVIVMDMGFPSLYTHTVLEINVITPAATNLSFVPETVEGPVSVFEGRSIGYVFHTVEAFEVGGTGDTRFIRYEVLSIVPEEPVQPFEVNSTTGELYVNGELDSERNSEYQVRLRAYSVRSPFFRPSPDEATLEVIVNDDNENAPTFPGPFNFTVAENSANGVLIGTVSATDSDDMNIGITFSLHPSTPSGLPVVVQSDGDILVNGVLDYEEGDTTFSFTVLAEDIPAHGQDSRTGSTQVTVNIGDRNDNPPVFVGTPYSISVRETEVMNMRVISFATTDLDSSANSDVLYSSPDIASTPFCLINTSIVVCDTSQLTSIEEQTTFEISLIATNPPARSGDETQSANVTVEISLILINEFEPVFVSDSVIYPGLYEEHCGLGYSIQNCTGFEVYDFNATDDDGGPSGNIEYTLLTSGVPFTVDGETGRLTINGRIDREEQSFYFLQVRVMDNPDVDGTVMSTVANISITILDIDDNPPVITEPFVFMVTENMTTTMASFGYVNISDPDINGTHEYLMVIPNQESNDYGCIVDGQGDYLPVTINMETGGLYFCEPVDFETQPRMYTFSVRVTDTGDLGPNSGRAFYMSDLQVMTVIIVDFNDHAPIIGNDDYTFSAEENTASGTVVGTVNATDEDSGAFGYLQFSLLYNESSVCSPALPFMIVKTSNTTADIQTCLYLDYEMQVVYTFQVVVCDNASIPMCDTASVTVSVIDRNDNSPLFTEDTYAAEIEETDTSSTQPFVLTVMVTDADSQPNSISNFSIMTTGTPFGLRDDTTSSANLYVMEPHLIDYDAGIRNYNLTIVARNEPAVPTDNTLSSMATVYVTITDVNDNAPIILPPYEFDVLENDNNATRVGCVSASDIDNGLNSALIYSIVDGTEAVSCSNDTPFSINGSGCLSTCDIFDYEDTSSYNFTVRVCDSGLPMLCNDRSIVVNVVDLNDNPIVYTDDPFFVDFNENSPPNETVLIITSTDEDSVANSMSTFEFVNTSSPFGIRDGNVVYYTGSEVLDYEAGPRLYILHLRGTNSPALAGDTVWTVDVVVAVNIVDRNDHPPVFDPEQDIRVLSEHDGTFTYTLATTDTDTDPNSDVTYAIIDASPFTIVGSTLLVFDSSAIDFDPPNNITQYVLTIQATNVPAAVDDETQTANFTLTLNVTDINDNAPQCIGPNSFTVRENATVGISVRRYRSIDIDSGMNGNDGLLYDINDSGSIGSGDPVCTFEDPFRIYPETGYIYPCFPLDFEEQTAYNVTITVMDSGTPSPMVTVCPVEMLIVDINDNDPVFNPPSVFSVQETASTVPPAEVGCINGSDADTEENGEIIYTFSEVECNEDNPFQIDTTTGCISVCYDLDHERDSSYNLTVILTDNSYPFRSTTGNITVLVVNENDHAPIITSPSIVYVTEEEDNATVTTVEVEDLDAPPFNSVTFSLADDASGLFTINATSGTISTTEPLNREMTLYYDIVVQVTDGKFTTTQIMTVILTDINDNAPVYEGSSTYAFDEESIFQIVLVYSDEDTANNSVHVFSVNNPVFSINSTGILTNLELLDRDPRTGGQPNLTIIVTVEDGDNVVETPIMIVLNDINDNAPVPQLPFTADILDGTASGTTVFTVTATDADAGENAELEFSIDAASDIFAIDTNSGNVTALQNITLDSDVSEDLILTVRIQDNGVFRRTTLQSYTFTVINFVPRFPEDVYLFYITENDLGGVIANITAMDRDRNTSNDEFQYMILSATPYDSGFSIVSEGDTGTLYRPSTYFDFEDSVQFDLTVAVSRHNMTIIDDKTTVRVVVVDRNDNPPRLSPLNIMAQVPEDIANGTTVQTAIGIDFDRGSNGMLSYNHSGLGEEAFEFDSSGNFRVVDSGFIDFELESTFTFRYQACDAGSPQLCSESGIINITITNVDDIPPAFNPNQYSTTIAEDFDLNRVILSVEFDDEDTPLTDVLLSLSPPQTLFQIAQVSGSLMTTNIPLDREKTRTHEFHVVANDTSGQTSSASVTIHLSDINDVRPHVEPLQSTASFTEGGDPTLIASTLSVVDEDDVSVYPLTSIDISLHPSPDSAESYPLTGGICDHANYSLLYDENVYSMCGAESSCLYLFVPGDIVVSSGGSLADKVLTTGSRSGFARYLRLFTGGNFDMFSVSLWIRLGTTDASGSIFELRTTADFELNLQIDTFNDGTGRLTLFSRERTNTLVSTGALNTHDNEWHHIAVVRDTEYFTIYFDGSEGARRNSSTLFDNSFSTTSFFFGVGLESEYLAEIYMCLSNISLEDVQCSVTCGESFGIQNSTDDVTASINLRTRSVRLEYTGNSNMASQTKLAEALRKVLFSYNTAIEEPHPLSRGIFVRVSDVVGPSDERGVITLEADLINDQKPVLDLNGFSEEGIDFATTFEELSEGIVLISDSAVLYDEDSGFSTISRIKIDILSPTSTEEIFVSGSVEGLSITPTNSSSIVIISSTSDEHFPGLYLDALRAVKYRDLQDEPEEAHRSIQFTVYDMGGTFVNSPLPITNVIVVPTNDMPVLDLNSLSSTVTDTSVLFLEHDGEVRLLLGTSQSISDPDSMLISQAIITLTIRPDGLSEALQLESAGVATTVTEDFDSASGTLTLTGTHDFDTWLDILRRVEYTNTYGNPDEDVMRQVSMQVVDDGGAISAPTYVNISVAPFNNPPEIYLGGPGVENFHTVFVEDGPCIPIANSSMEIFDVDSETIVFGRVTLRTTNADFDHENLQRDINTLPGRQIVFVTLDDPSLDNYEVALPQVVYCNSADEPEEGIREIEVGVRDSGSNFPSFSLTFVEIQRINDQPTLQVESLNNISIRGVPTVILNKNSIVLEDSDDNRFLALYIFITNEQDGRESETIIFDTTLPANTTSVGSLLTENGEILNNVTFRGEGADAAQVINTISNIRYRNTDDNLTVDPPRIICLQVADKSLYFSERVCVSVILSPPNTDKPNITSNFSTFTFNETADLVTIATVTAEDDDVDLAGQIEYSVFKVLSIPEGGTQEDTTTSGIFEVNTTSGVLTAPQGLDAEAYTHHIVTVRASDLGNPVEIDDIDIEIIVIDINDIAPLFKNGPFILDTVTEAQLSFGEIGTVTAEDDDLTSPNNDVESYFLSTDDIRFQINEFGVISYTEELDADVGDPNIVLTVGARDSGTPQLTGYTTVHFLIGEINDYEARVDQVSAALFVVDVPPTPQSIGPAMRIEDIDRSTSTIISVIVKLNLNPNDQERGYDRCLTVCQPERIAHAGLTTSIDLFQLPDPDTIFRTDDGNTDGLQFIQIDESSCDAVRMTRHNLDDRESDGYGRIARSQFSHIDNFLTGDFSISFVAKHKREGFVIVIPDMTNENEQPVDVGRAFGIWLRRRNVRLTYVYGPNEEQAQLDYVVPSGEEFYDSSVPLNEAKTRHFTVIFSSSTLQAHIYIDCNLVFTGALEGELVVPNIDSDVFIGQSRPSSVGGGRLEGDLHGVFYHPTALSAEEISDFCSCGFETLNLPSSIPESITSERTVSSSEVTLSFSPTQSIIPSDDMVSVLRGIMYENTFNPPTFDPVRELEFTVDENNNEDTAITSGSIALVTSDTTLPEIDLSGPVVSGINYFVDFTEDDGAVRVTDDVRLDRDVPQPAVPTFDQIEIVLKNGIDADEVLLATSSNQYITILGNRTASLTIQGPGDSSDFLSALETVVYENTNDRPTTDFLRTVEFTVTDTKGDMNDPIAVTTVQVIAVNDAPQISLTENGIVTMRNVEYNEGSPIGVGLAPELSIVDVDNDTLYSATVVLDSPQRFSDGLIIEALPLELTRHYLNGVLTLTGPASFSIFEEALRNISFESSDSPFLDNSGNPLNSTDRIVNITVSDGLVSSDPVIVNIEFLPVDDPPHIQGAPDEITYLEGTAPVNIAPTVVLEDDDNDQLNSLQIDLVDPLDGDVLSDGTISSPLLRFDLKPLTEFQNILNQITFVNNADEPILSDRRINIQVCDFTACDRVSVVIKIENANDNTPEFDEALYTYALSEDIAVGTTIDTLAVSDRDDRDSFTTNFLYRTDPSSLPFRLGQIGSRDEIQLIVDDGLDAETVGSYEFTIFVSDGDNEGNTTINITVLNINEPPSISFETSTATIVGSPNSETQLLQVGFSVTDPDIGDVVLEAHLSIRDIPTGSNETLVLITEVENITFEETAGVFQLFITSNINLTLEDALQNIYYAARQEVTETTVRRFVDITVFDGSGLESERVTVTVSLASIPVFSNSTYTVKLIEGILHTEFLQVMASVESGGDVINYDVEQNVGVIINEATGYLSLSELLDREGGTTKSFEVFAIDNLPPPRTGTATVSITILDANDVKPTVILEQPNITIYTDTAELILPNITVLDPDTSVGIIHATITVVGERDLVASPFTGEICVDEHDTLRKMEQVCNLVNYTDVLSSQGSNNSGATLEVDMFGNHILTNTDNGYLGINTTDLGFLTGTISSLTAAFWFKPQDSGYIVYVGNHDPVERYYAIYYDMDANQIIVTLKRAELTGLEAQIRVIFQVSFPLNDGNWHFVMIQYSNRNLVCVVDAVRIESEAVSYKEEPFIGQVMGK